MSGTTGSPDAINQAAGLMSSDPQGVAEAFDAADHLPKDPEPPGSFPFGNGRRRLHVGRYRVVYEIDGEDVAVVRLGRVGR